jgi:hypothetical protein
MTECPAMWPMRTARRRRLDPFRTGDGPGNWSLDLLRTDEEAQAGFRERARPVVCRHRSQTKADVTELRRRYGSPVFGRCRVWDLVLKLGACVDPSDERLWCASQLVHVLQMLEQMEADGVATPEMVLVALTHDLGKLLLLTDEDPANVVCMNAGVGEQPGGAGLDASLLQWNHDEFTYQRLKDHIDEDLAWLVRYHSLELPTAEALMDDHDRERAARLLVPFAHYDHATKSPYHLPAKPITAYREVIEAAFPRPITF